MQEIIKKYKEEVCKNCTADCYSSKGIVVTKYKNTLYARCVDYKNKNKSTRKNGFWLKWRV